MKFRNALANDTSGVYNLTGTIVDSAGNTLTTSDHGGSHFNNTTIKVKLPTAIVPNTDVQRVIEILLIFK